MYRIAKYRVKRYFKKHIETDVDELIKRLGYSHELVTRIVTELIEEGTISGPYRYGDDRRYDGIV